jgi:LPXTG-site transpeptidase (sortase) family protein
VAAARGVAALLALALLGCGGDARPEPPPAAERPARAESPERKQRPRSVEVADPRRLEIPAIGVSAPVIELGLNRDRTLEVPEDFGDTGWWEGGPEPGERGAAVIVGHVDSETGPAVFYRLDELRPGDELRVQRTDGSRARFVVRRLERHAKAEFPTRAVYARTRQPTLRLVTCSGEFDSTTGHYVDNTIVFADAG